MSVGETPRTIAAHINATRVISPGGHVGEVKTPWLHALVKVTRGEFADCIGIVESVDRVEGKLGRKLVLGLWIPAKQQTTYIDYNYVVEKL
ncbi:hypothetical protein V5O48_019561, partial [Marasmius crinis-equi]